ncbi:MAG: sodium-translocating pyrophosphatase, partial [Planctomycetota bacterium]
MTEFIYLGIGGGALGIIGAVIFAMQVLKKDAGPQEVQDIGKLIQEGAMAFLKREYTILAFVVAVAFGALAVFVDYNLLDNATIARLNAAAEKANGFGEGPWTALAYLCGAVGSGIAGWAGMSIAVRSNTRTTAACMEGLNPGLRVAFGAGTVMGLTVVGIGLLGVSVLWFIFKDPNIVAGFGFGASTIALFARVGGGIYTKAADVGADLVGKVEAGIPEDDPRNPATIADNVGDNVGDVAGMGADLFESYAGSIIACLALAGATVAAGDPVMGFDDKLMVLPLAIAALGIVCSIIGTFFVRTKPDADMNSLLWSLRYGIFGAGALALVATFFLVKQLDLSLDYLWVVVTGLVAGQIIGYFTEYFTSYEYKPVKWMAEQAKTGAGSVMISGLSVGLMSVVIPAIAVGAAIWIAHDLAGLYGIALAGVGMLSTLGITLATDAYGPVADNAGGLAEQAHLDPSVREKTDALDSLGNTTAATGKGFAIGSAVLTALALMAAYVQVTGLGEKGLDLMHVPVMVGAMLGGMLPFLFAALTMKAVGDAANDMIEEVRRQFREIPGLREGKEGVKPDAARAVDISTQGSLKAMMLPGVIAILSPIVVGALLGAEALGGLLIGSILAGFLLAVFMANAGGAWDNAKKYIETGQHGGKGSDAHHAAVVGDTV